MIYLNLLLLHDLILAKCPNHSCAINIHLQAVADITVQRHFDSQIDPVCPVS